MAATTNGRAAGASFTATLARTNDNGLQIQERPGVWLNYSKFGPRPVVPPLGATVRITLDARGFIRELVELDLGDDDRPPAQLPLDDDEAPRERPRPLSSSIARLALIKAAARFHAERPDSTTTDVITTASYWEAWVESSA